MKRAALGALLSHWMRHPLQLLILLTGLALSTALWSAVQAINSEARASYSRAAAQLGLSDTEILFPKSGYITVSRYVMLRREGWQLSPVLEGRWRLRNGSVKLIGVDLLTHPTLPAVSSSPRSQLDSLRPPGRLFLNPSTMEKLNGHADLPPITLSGDLPTGVVLSDISLAEKLLRRDGQISQLIILPDQPMGLEPLESLAPELQQRMSNNTQVGRLTDSFHLNLTAFGLLSFAVGLFIVHGAVGLGIEQRLNLIRGLRSMGVSLRLLACLILAELMLIALVAGGIGLVLGYLVAGALLPDVSATLAGLYGETVEGSLGLRLSWISSGIGMAAFGTLISSTQAIVSIYKTPLLPTPPMQFSSQGARSRQQRLILCAAGLICAGIAANVMLEGLIGGFVLLAGMMLGAALILPLVLSGCLVLGSRTATGALSEWVWADTRRLLPGITLALRALLLALATNIGVGTMVSSFRLTFIGWIEQRLSADLYVTVHEDEFAKEVKAWLTGHNIIVLPIRWSELSYEGSAVRVYGIVDHSSYRETWPILQAHGASWDQIFDGTGAMINEQLARRQNLWPGDKLALTNEWQTTVSGVYSDYGNPHGQAIVSLPNLLKNVNNVPNRQFGLHLPAKDRANLMKNLQETFDSKTISIVDQAEIRSRSLAVFDRTFTITGALNILTLGVAAFAVLTSLLTLWNMRLHQVAPIWALGVSRRQLAWLELLRSLSLTTLTAILALPLGLILAWVLLSVINVEAFGWKLPMHLFPMDWLILLVLALLASAVAAAVPALKMARIRPTELLKVFAHDR